MVKIKDVAVAAGVSTATVSRVLSDHPHVRPELRARGRGAVAAVEYRPQQVARSRRAPPTQPLGR